MLEAVTDGFTVDRTSPISHVTNFAGVDNSEASLVRAELQDEM